MTIADQFAAAFTALAEQAHRDAGPSAPPNVKIWFADAFGTSRVTYENWAGAKQPTPAARGKGRAIGLRFLEHVKTLAANGTIDQTLVTKFAGLLDELHAGAKARADGHAGAAAAQPTPLGVRARADQLLLRSRDGAPLIVTAWDQTDRELLGVPKPDYFQMPNHLPRESDSPIQRAIKEAAAKRVPARRLVAISTAKSADMPIHPGTSTHTGLTHSAHYNLTRTMLGSQLWPLRVRPGGGSLARFAEVYDEARTDYTSPLVVHDLPPVLFLDDLPDHLDLDELPDLVDVICRKVGDVPSPIIVATVPAEYIDQLAPDRTAALLEAQLVTIGVKFDRHPSDLDLGQDMLRAGVGADLPFVIQAIAGPATLAARLVDASVQERAILDAVACSDLLSGLDVSDIQTLAAAALQERDPRALLSDDQFHRALTRLQAPPNARVAAFLDNRHGQLTLTHEAADHVEPSETLLRALPSDPSRHRAATVLAARAPDGDSHVDLYGGTPTHATDRPVRLASRRDQTLDALVTHGERWDPATIWEVTRDIAVTALRLAPHDDVLAWLDGQTSRSPLVWAAVAQVHEIRLDDGPHDWEYGDYDPRPLVPGYRTHDDRAAAIGALRAGIDAGGLVLLRLVGDLQASTVTAGDGIGPEAEATYLWAAEAGDPVAALRHALAPVGRTGPGLLWGTFWGGSGTDLVGKADEAAFAEADRRLAPLPESTLPAWVVPNLRALCTAAAGNGPAAMQQLNIALAAGLVDGRLPILGDANGMDTIYGEVEADGFRGDLVTTATKPQLDMFAGDVHTLLETVKPTGQLLTELVRLLPRPDAARVLADTDEDLNGFLLQRQAWTGDRKALLRHVIRMIDAGHRDIAKQILTHDTRRAGAHNRWVEEQLAAGHSHETPPPYAFDDTSVFAALRAAQQHLDGPRATRRKAAQTLRRIAMDVIRDNGFLPALGYAHGHIDTDRWGQGADDLVRRALASYDPALAAVIGARVAMLPHTPWPHDQTLPPVTVEDAPLPDGVRRHQFRAAASRLDDVRVHPWVRATVRQLAKDIGRYAHSDEPPAFVSLGSRLHRDLAAVPGLLDRLATIADAPAGADAVAELAQVLVDSDAGPAPLTVGDATDVVRGLELARAWELLAKVLHDITGPHPEPPEDETPDAAMVAAIAELFEDDPSSG